MDPEMKKAVEELGGAFAEFRKANDERLVQIEKEGAADPLLTEKVDKINKALDGYEATNKKLTEDLVAARTAATEAKTRAEELEVKFNRLGVPGGAAGAGATAPNAKEFKFLQTYYRNGTLDKRIVGTPDEAKQLSEGFWNMCRRGRESMTPEEIKTLVVSDDTAGGYLSPPEYVREIIKAIVLISPVRSYIRMRNTVQQAIQIPKRTQTSSATWVAEAALRQEAQNPAYGLVKLDTFEATAEHYVSMQELEDAVFDLEVELSQEFAEQFAKAEGAAFIAGNGVGKPLGFLDPSVGCPSTNSGSAAGIADANGQANGIMTACYALKTAYAANAVWFLNRQTLGAVRMLKDLHNNYIWLPGLAGNQPNTILGYPYAEMPDMPAIAANAFPIAFGDWKRGYCGVDRIALSVLRDPYTRANVGQVKFVARRRVGGGVTLAEAIQLVKCSA